MTKRKVTKREQAIADLAKAQSAAEAMAAVQDLPRADRPVAQFAAAMDRIVDATAK